MRDDVATEGFRGVVPIADLQVVYAAVGAKSICAKYQGEPCMSALDEHSPKALGAFPRVSLAWNIITFNHPALIQELSSSFSSISSRSSSFPAVVMVTTQNQNEC